MKNFKIIIVLFGLLTSAIFLSCNEDNKEEDPPTNDYKVNINGVFTGEKPQSAAGITSITYNTDGLVSSMSTSDATIIFEYHNIQTRTNNDEPYIRMTISEDNQEMVIDMKLGRDGFVESCTEKLKYSNKIETTYWWFKYNSDGQLNYMKRSEGGNEETFITYSNGNIVKVKQMSNGALDWENEILYTSEDVKNPIENKGCIMLFDATFGIDMDEMFYAYYAGLLGKATKLLPIGSRSNNESIYYKWSLNANGYPKSVVVDGSNFEFKW